MKIYRLSFVYIDKAILGKFKQSYLRNRSIISVGEKMQTMYMQPAETKQIKIDTIKLLPPFLASFPYLWQNKRNFLKCIPLISHFVVILRTVSVFYCFFKSLSSQFTSPKRPILQHELYQCECNLGRCRNWFYPWNSQRLSSIL